jgi:hypothetical protein
VYLPHPAIAPWVMDYIEEHASFPNGRYDDQVDQTTQALQRLLTDKRIFTARESDLRVNPFEIPEHWPRGYALRAGLNRAAIVWAARDPESGRIFIYKERLDPRANPAEHARAIREAGDWIPGVMDLAGCGRSADDRAKLLETYRQQGLHLVAAEDAVEAGIQQIRLLLAKDQLKMFHTLNNLLNEYRQHQLDENGSVVPGNEELLACCRALIVSGARRMCTKPVKRPRFVEPVYHGERDWMR